MNRYHIIQPQKNTDFITNDDPSIEQEEARCCSFRDGNPFQEKPCHTTMSYSGFEPEPTRLQAEGHSHHTGWATPF
ncbi:hypothetical protein TNCV_1814601 [Trichonephila clavipes]|nr:hypothetical protein TNCV_1814601 [Trichonephila clavipes]